jgi:hypothetical protein
MKIMRIESATGQAPEKYVTYAARGHAQAQG